SLECRRVPPARSEPLALRRLEGVAEPYSRVPHRDHDHPLGERAAPVVCLHGHPAAGARVFYNILTRLGKRHSEAHRRLRIEADLGRQATSPYGDAHSAAWASNKSRSPSFAASANAPANWSNERSSNWDGTSTSRVTPSRACPAGGRAIRWRRGGSRFARPCACRAAAPPRARHP